MSAKCFCKWKSAISCISLLLTWLDVGSIAMLWSVNALYDNLFIGTLNLVSVRQHLLPSVDAYLIPLTFDLCCHWKCIKG